MGLPDFLVIGAPKAGSTALHAALVVHPQLHLSDPKEPKFFLTDGRRPRRRDHRGPGDAHSAREWIWRREHYERLFDDAPPGTLTGESTPFYLWDVAAHARLAAAVPDARLIAVVRDPIDRAYSNWTHLRSDGLEPETDFLRACDLETHRAARGWAPFWRYLGLGRYGEQLAHLYQHFPREQVHVLRYRELVDDPRRALDDIAGFLGVEPGLVGDIPGSNTHGWAAPTPLNTSLRYAVRAGAVLGASPRRGRGGWRSGRCCARCTGPVRTARHSMSGCAANSSSGSATTSGCSRICWAARFRTGWATAAAARTPSAGRSRRRDARPPSRSGCRSASRRG